jgi:hypothetical protein
MKTTRELICDRAVMLARAGASTERAITQAIWEHTPGPRRAVDVEREVRGMLEIRAAIERALNPALVTLAPPRQPGTIPPAPAPGWGVDGLRLRPAPMNRATGKLPDGAAVRALMDATRHGIGRVLPRRIIDPRCVLWALRIALAKVAPVLHQQRGRSVRTEVLATKGWKVVTR